MDDDFDGEATKTTPKQALMGWVKSKLPPEVSITAHSVVQLEVGRRLMVLL